MKHKTSAWAPIFFDQIVLDIPDRSRCFPVYPFEAYLLLKLTASHSPFSYGCCPFRSFVAKIWPY